MIDLEPRGLRNERLEVVTPTSIMIGDEVYAVHDTGVEEEPGPGVHVDVIAFDNPEIAAEMDAAYIQGNPNCATPIQHWSGPRVFVEKIMKGSATWIGVNPEGEVVSHEFDANRKDGNGVLVYGSGWIGSWVAGPEGVKFVEVCIPPFEEDGTIEVARPEDEVVGETAIPLLFRAMYYTLMGLPWKDEGAVEIVGERLRLNSFGLGDAREIFELIDRNREHLSQNGDVTASKYLTLQDIVKSIVEPKPRRTRYAIRNESGRYVGTINLEIDGNDPSSAEIGYYLGAEFQGHGYVTEAVKLLVSQVFNETKIKTLYTVIDARNLASQRVMKRTGFEKVGEVDMDGWSHYRYEKVLES